MIGIKEFQNQKENTTPFGKKNDNEPRISHNPWENYSAYHQMIGNHAANGSLVWQRAKGAENLQRSCDDTFLQRNLGNNYMQSLTEAPNNSGQFTNVSLVQRKPT